MCFEATLSGWLLLARGQVALFFLGLISFIFHTLSQGSNLNLGAYFGWFLMHLYWNCERIFLQIWIFPWGFGDLYLEQDLTCYKHPSPTLTISLRLSLAHAPPLLKSLLLQLSIYRKRAHDCSPCFVIWAALLHIPLAIGSQFLFLPDRYQFLWFLHLKSKCRRATKAKCSPAAFFSACLPPVKPPTWCLSSFADKILAFLIKKSFSALQIPNAC